MRKNILRLTAALFAAALTGILACSSDPCQQMGCGSMMGGSSTSTNCNSSSSSKVNCPSGYHQVGNACYKD